MNAKIVKSIWAKQALLASGWQNHVLITLDPHGNIVSTDVDQQIPEADCQLVRGTLIPGITNLHSHAHQRAMAGLAEKSIAGKDNRDSFWSWRSVMYHYLEKIQADDLSNIFVELV